MIEVGKRDTNAASMVGRVCVVTGATSGVGRACAAGLVRRGATVALVARDRGRADETVRELRQLAASGGSAQAFLADLALQSDVRAVASELLEAYPRIHVLVNNAGVINLRYTETADGIETTFAVNHLAPFLLTNLLLDRLIESAPARIVNVASDAHKFVSGIAFDDLGFRSGYKSMRVYGQSKLANILYTLELARRLEGTGVTVNSLHPGAVASGLGRNNGTIARLLIRCLAPFFRSPERGAETAVYLACSPDVEGVTGRYFVDCRAVRPNPNGEDAVAARRLFEVSERMTGVSTTGEAREGASA